MRQEHSSRESRPPVVPAGPARSQHASLSLHCSLSRAEWSHARVQCSFLHHVTILLWCLPYMVQSDTTVSCTLATVSAAANRACGILLLVWVLFTPPFTSGSLSSMHEHLFPALLSWVLPTQAFWVSLILAYLECKPLIGCSSDFLMTEYSLILFSFSWPTSLSNYFTVFLCAVCSKYMYCV